MNKAIRVIAVAGVMLLSMALPALAEVSITQVKAEPVSPWGKVYLQYEAAGTLLDNVDQYRLEVSASNRMTGVVTTAKTLTGDTSVALGAHKLIWDLAADELDFSGQKLNFIVTYAPPLYQVIDLAAGTSATSYPVSSLADVPSGGWTDEYKTTKLVLRRIEAGTYMMQNSGSTTITKPFYIGVFEVTQRQWELVMGTRPSFFSNSSYYQSRPVEQVSYNKIRGSSAGAGWPASSAVDASSFLGVLRAKTGLDFDLPTEAQWEYACRAGTTTDYNNGTSNTGSSYANMNNVGRYRYNGGSSNSSACTTSGGTAKVGSYEPNKWGLYDMHGNVWEWCLDWYGSLAYGEDPKGSSSGSRRVGRGGSWGDYASYCTSSYRGSNSPSYVYGHNGFRLVRTPVKQ